MDKKQLVKDLLRFNVSSFRIRAFKLIAFIRYKLFLKSFQKNKSTFDYKTIPVIINNFNRLSYLRELLRWLERAGMKNIYILDNASTYPPLLEFYKNSTHKIIYLGANLGHLALWKSKYFNQFKSSFYIYTDPDVVPIEECPNDAIAQFLDILLAHSQLEKVGFSLKIDDLPLQYAKREEVKNWEEKFWQNEIAPGIFDAAIDTTFALYKPYTNGNIWVSPAVRTGFPLTARHMPWYENSAQPDEETLYYQAHIKKGASHWIK
jgi:hypothetical protein